jgi:hypothetical protein
MKSRERERQRIEKERWRVKVRELEIEREKVRELEREKESEGFFFQVKTAVDQKTSFSDIKMHLASVKQSGQLSLLSLSLYLLLSLFSSTSFISLPLLCMFVSSSHPPVQIHASFLLTRSGR